MKIKLLKYASNADFDAGSNRESKPPIAIGGVTLQPLVKGRTIASLLWLGADDKQPSLLHLALNDGSSIFVRSGYDGVPEVVFRPRSK